MQDLIDTANYVRQKGIEFPDVETMKEHGYQYEPYAEGIYHGVGFVKPRKATDKIESMARIGGGCCGEWDLYASPKSGFYMKHERLETRMPASYHLLKIFARDFPLFEAAFYGWIESGMK